MYHRYVLKELRHRHNRTLVNILGIAIGIALFVSINAASAAYKRAASQPFRDLGADVVVQRPEQRAANQSQPTSMRGIRLPFSNQLLTRDDLEKLKTISGVDSMASSLRLWDFEASGFRTIIGVDLTQPSLGPVKVKDWLAGGRFPEREGEVVLEKHYAKFHQATIGGTTEIAGRIFRIVGLLEIKEGSQIASANIYLALKEAQSLLGEDANGVNVVYLRLKNPALLSEVKTDIARQMKGMSVTSSDSFLELMGGVAKISDQFFLIVSIIALAGAVLLIIKAMLSNLVERSREVGILKAVGWTERDVQRQLMAEVFLQSLMGGICGIILGYFFSYLLGFLSITIPTPWDINLLPAAAKDMEAASKAVRLPVSVSAGLAAISLALSLVVGAMASYLMGRRTARMKPADILRQV